MKSEAINIEVESTPTAEEIRTERTREAIENPQSIDLSEYGIVESEVATFKQVEALFEGHPELIGGILRNYHSAIRLAVANDFGWRHHRRYTHEFNLGEISEFQVGQNAVAIRFIDNANVDVIDPDDRVSDEREVLLDSGKGFENARYGAELCISITPPRGQKEEWNLILLFSTDYHTAETAWNSRMGSEYQPTDQYRFDGVYVRSLKEISPVKLTLDQAEGRGVVGDIHFDQVVSLVEESYPMPDVDVSESCRRLEELFGETQSNNYEELEKMKQAIVDFATLIKQEPTTGEQCLSEMGKCRIVPDVFKQFAQKHYGIEGIDMDHYGSSRGNYHRVNTWQGLCIDWTAKQFSRFDNKPYPYIYRLTDDHFLGKPYSLWTDQEKEEEAHLEYLEHKGIEY